MPHGDETFSPMIKERTELITPALSGLLDFWLGKCNGAHPPISSAISPVDLRPWKDNIVIFEIIGDDDFVYSFYGRALAEAFGHSRLGATLDVLPPEQRAILAAEYEAVRRERLPVARIHMADFGNGIGTWERLVLPLSSDGETVDKLLVAAFELTAPHPASEPAVPLMPEPVPVTAPESTADPAPDHTDPLQDEHTGAPA